MANQEQKVTNTPRPGTTDLPLMRGDIVCLDAREALLLVRAGAHGPEISLLAGRERRDLGSVTFSVSENAFRSLPATPPEFREGEPKTQAGLQPRIWITLHAEGYTLDLTFYSNKGPLITVKDGQGAEVGRARFNYDGEGWVFS